MEKGHTNGHWHGWIHNVRELSTKLVRQNRLEEYPIAKCHMGWMTQIKDSGTQRTVSGCIPVLAANYMEDDSHVYVKRQNPDLSWQGA